MPIEEPMTIDERRKYLHKVQQRYRQAKHTERSALLTTHPGDPGHRLAPQKPNSLTQRRPASPQAPPPA